MSVNWSELKTADGDASAVPALIGQMAAPDRAVSARAYRILCDLVTFDGRLFSAAPYVAAELVERLKHDRIANRELALRALASILASEDCGDGEGQVASATKAGFEDLAWRTVENEIELYSDVLSHSAGDVRRAAILVLSCFRYRADEARETLRLASASASTDQERDDIEKADVNPRLDPSDPHIRLLMERRAAGKSAFMPITADGMKRETVRSKVVARLMRWFGPSRG